MSEFDLYADDDLDPGFRADLQEELDRTHGAPEYSREVDDYIPASQIWYGADVIQRASRDGKGGNATPAPFTGRGGGAGDNLHDEAA